MERATRTDFGTWEAETTGIAEPEITTGRAIAIATGAAALAGGISTLFSRRPADSASTGAGRAAGAAVDHVVGFAASGGDRASDLASRAGSGRDAAADGVGSLGSRASGLLNAGSTRVAGSVQSARDGSERGGQRVADEIESLTRRLQALDPSRFGSLVQGSREKAGGVVSGATGSIAASLVAASDKARQVVPEVTGPAARAVETRAREIGHGVVASGQAGRDRLSGAREAITDAPLESVGVTVRDGLTRLRDDVTPVVRDAAIQAAAKAIEIWDASREEAQAALAGEGLAGATGKATELTSKAKDTTAQVAARAGDVAQVTATDLAARGAELAARTADSRERIGVATRQAASATGETSREAGSAAVWAAIAGGVVYYALLDEQRREQVNQFAQTVFGGARELLRDIQGYDADF